MLRNKYNMSNYIYQNCQVSQDSKHENKDTFTQTIICQVN